MANRIGDSSVSSSQMEYVENEKEIVCGCKRLAPVFTSWTNDNLGRRFYGCRNFKAGGCRFFKWYDERFSQRANELLVYLRDNERKLAKENEFLEKENDMLKTQLFSLGITFDGVNSSSRRQRFGIGSSKSKVVDKRVRVESIADYELVQMVRKLEMEKEDLNKKSKKMKQKAYAIEKANKTYKLLLVVISLGFTWLYFSCKLLCNEICVGALP